MTLHLLDVSRYQVERANPLDLAKSRTARLDIANVALTGGRGYVSGTWARTYLDRAGALGMGRSTYHWLDGRTSGAQQAAENIERLRSLLGTAMSGFAHCVDVEETGKDGIPPPTWRHVTDYVDAVQQALGRHVAIYTGDWWWPGSWHGALLTPFLMAQPNTGKVGTYPGDASPEWVASYGGWEELSIMQWGVQPLPGTGDCSLSALRDHGVWAALTGGDVLMPNADPGNSQPSAWIGAPIVSPAVSEIQEMARQMLQSSAKAGATAADVSWTVDDDGWPRPALPLAPTAAGAEVCAPVVQAELADWIAVGGSNSGCVGDANHGTGFHRGADYVPPTDYSRRRDPNGADGPYVNWKYACAGDFAHNGNPALRAMHKRALALIMAGRFPMICEFIGQPDADGPVMYWSVWEGVLRRYTGQGHDNWSHLSFFRSRVNQQPRIWKEVQMSFTSDFLAALKNSDVRTELVKILANTDGVFAAPGNPKPGKNPDGTDVNTHWTLSSYMQGVYNATVSARGYSADARTAAMSLVAPVAALIVYAKAEEGEVPPTAEQVTDAFMAGLQGTPDDATAAALVAILGPDRAYQVAQLMLNPPAPAPA